MLFKKIKRFLKLDMVTIFDKWGGDTIGGSYFYNYILNYIATLFGFSLILFPGIAMKASWLYIPAGLMMLWFPVMIVAIFLVRWFQAFFYTESNFIVKADIIDFKKNYHKIRGFSDDFFEQFNTDIDLDDFMLWAVKKNDLITVKRLIEKGVDINKENMIYEEIVETYFEKTPLLTAIESKNFQMTKSLIELGANFNLFHRYSSPLLSAVYAEQIEIIKFLHDTGVDINERHPMTGFSPILKAISAGSKKSVMALIECGVEINAEVQKYSFHKVKKLQKYATSPFKELYDEAGYKLYKTVVDIHNMICKHFNEI